MREVCVSVDSCRVGVRRKAWELPFVAEPEELAGLRRVMRLHLERWGLPHCIDAARLCVNELVSNVIRHVGAGTPTTLSVSMNGTRLRIEVHDPDTRALPTLLSARAEDVSGRGMALVDALADRWGVVLRADSKVTWCELTTGLTAPDGHVGEATVMRAEALLMLYGVGASSPERDASLLTLAVAEEAAVGLIGDVLHWLRAHGRDADETLDRAQTRFESDVMRQL